MFELLNIYVMEIILILAIVWLFLYHGKLFAKHQVVEKIIFKDRQEFRDRMLALSKEMNGQIYQLSFRKDLQCDFIKYQLDYFWGIKITIKINSKNENISLEKIRAWIESKFECQVEGYRDTISIDCKNNLNKITDVVDYFILLCNIDTFENITGMVVHKSSIEDQIG